MEAKLYFVVFSTIATHFLCAYPGTSPDDKTTPRFKVYAKGLDDKGSQGTSDPYVTITYSDGDGKDEKEIGRSTILTNEEYPDWGDLFTFNWDRRQNQRWHFEYDHGNSRDDETLGYVWVT